MGLNVQLLKESFRAIRPHAVEIVEQFYAELFRAHPEAKSLFNPKEMTKQHKALVNGLAHIVEFVEETDHLVDYLRKMGARHVDYGTQTEQFDWVGEALLNTLAYAFDDQWSEELRDTWATAFGVIAKEMKIGMKMEVERRAKKQFHKPSTAVGAILPTPAPAPTPSALKELATRLSQDLIKNAIEAHFASGEIQDLIQAKARELLVRAIEKEAKTLFAEANTEQEAA